MQIYIPSMMRPNTQITLSILASAGIRPTLVIPRGELKAYAAHAKNAELLPAPASAKGIALTRQFIMDRALKEGEDHICMMDDDLRFYVRRTDNLTLFRGAADTDIRSMIKEIDTQLCAFAHVGVTAKEGSNRRTESFADCARPLRVYAFAMRRVAEARVRYNPGLVQDDFDMTLQLLRKGYANRVLCDYANNQTSSNAPGGASTYRDIALHNASVKKLAKLHHPFVAVVEKQTKKAWQGQARLDVVVSWKKAFESGCAL